MDSLAIFCRQVRARSAEHRLAVASLGSARTHSTIVGILRQELDSMVRVVYLLSVTDRGRREELVAASAGGRQWSRPDRGGRVTDREMVELADRLNGWTKSVYGFGCAFIHLSSFHDYASRDPLGMIPEDERVAILHHMRHYHGGPIGDRPSFDELAQFFPSVFDKIASNLECYLGYLEECRDLVDGD